MTSEQVLERYGNIVLKKRGGNFIIVYILPYMEHLDFFIDESKARAYFNRLKKEFS